MALIILNRDFPGGPVVRFCAASGGGAGSIPGRGTKILCVFGKTKQNMVIILVPSGKCYTLSQMSSQLFLFINKYMCVF